MSYTDKQVLVRIPAYLPSEPSYPKVYSPRHLPTSGSSSLKSGSSCCTSSDSASAPHPPRIVRTPSKYRSAAYIYKDNRSYSRMAEPPRASRDNSAAGRKRKYVDTPAYLNRSSVVWCNSPTCLPQPPTNGDSPANVYRTPQTTEVPFENVPPIQPLRNIPFRLHSSLTGPAPEIPMGHPHTRSHSFDKRPQQMLDGPAENTPFVFKAHSGAHIYDRHHNGHGGGSHRLEPSAVRNSLNMRIYTSNPALNVIPQPEFWPGIRENIEDSARFMHNYKLSQEAEFPRSEVSGQYNAGAYPLRKTTSMFHLGGQPRDRSSAVFDAGVKANLLRKRHNESKDLDDLLRLADGTYNGNEFDFDVKTKGLGSDQDLEEFRDLKISESHEEQNGEPNGLPRSNLSSCTDDNSALSSIKPLQVSVDETDTLDNQADDALSELNNVLEIRDFGPSQPVKPEMPPNDGRPNVAEQVILRLNGELDSRHSNCHSPSYYSREHVHAQPVSGCRCGACYPHSWNADILRNPVRQSSLLWCPKEPAVVVHGLVEREPNVQSRPPLSDNQMTTAHTAQKPYSYPRAHQPLNQQQAWQANKKQFGCDDWGRNGVALMHRYTILRPSHEVGTARANRAENQRNEPLRHKSGTPNANDSDESSVDLDDRYV